MSQVINQDVLRSSFLFMGVSQEVLQQVAGYCRPMELGAGETLFEQDSEPDAMYFLESGQIHVMRSYPDGREVVLATEVPFYVIGEISLLANQPRSGSVVAVGDCDLVMLRRDDIFQMCHDMPQVAVQALDHLGKRLYRMNLHVRESAIGDVNARIATILMLLAKNQPGEIEQAVPAASIARATALDTDVVEQSLKKWVEEGIIEVNGPQITINDVNRLHQIAG